MDCQQEPYLDLGFFLFLTIVAVSLVNLDYEMQVVVNIIAALLLVLLPNLVAGVEYTLRRPMGNKLLKVQHLL